MASNENLPTMSITSISKQFEKAIQVKKARALMDELDGYKRNLSKLMNAKTAESENTQPLMKEKYLQAYQNMQKLIEQLEDEKDKADLQKILNLQNTFYKKIVIEKPSISLEEKVEEVLNPVLEMPAVIEDVEEEVLSIPGSPIESQSSFDTNESIETRSLAESSKTEFDASKEAARKGILALFSNELNSNPTTVLHNLLPIAYKKFFTIKDGRLAALGTHKSLIEQAVGLKDGQIHMDEFNPRLFDELQSKYPRSGLWSILKSLTPIHDHFSAQDKAYACMDAVRLMSQSRIIKTEKTQYALNVLNYAASFVPEKGDWVLSLQRLLSGIGHDHLAVWFKRKLNQGHYELPKDLLNRVQINWLDESIPHPLARQAQKLKQWVEFEQQKLVSDSGGVLESINTNGALIHFKSLAVALGSKDKNCYVWHDNRLSYIHDNYEVDEDIKVINAGVLNDAKQKYSNVTYKFLKEEDVHTLITNNTNPQHRPPLANLQIKRWLYDVEKEHREDALRWVPARKQEEICNLIKAKYKLIYLINGYYENEVLMLTNLDEFKSILKSRLEEIKLGLSEHDVLEADQLVIERYIQMLTQFSNLQTRLRDKHPVPAVNTSIQQSLIALEEEFNSPVFHQYMTALNSLGAASEKIKEVIGKYPSLFMVRNIVGTTTPMEIRSKNQAEAYIQPVLMRLARVGDKFKEMQSICENKKSPMQAEATLVGKMLGHVREFVKRFDESVIGYTEYKSIQKAMQGYLSQHQAPQEAAIKAILSSKYMNNPRAYLHNLLPLISPNLFIEEEGALNMVAPDQNWRLIFQALGVDVYDKNNPIAIDPSQFNPDLLTKMMEKYPSEQVVFRFLKTLKPIGPGFSAEQKVDACIDLAIQISQKKVVSTQKLQFVLYILAYAHNEVTAFAKNDVKALSALSKIEELFDKKPILEHSSLQEWIRKEFKKGKEAEIPAVLSAFVKKAQTNDKETPLSSLDWLGRKIKSVLVTEKSDEHLRNSAPTKK